MKITVPTIRSAVVGCTIRQVTPTVIYNDPARPNIYGAIAERPVIEYGLTSVTVFDRDLRAAARAKAALQGVAYTALVVTAYAVLIPLGFVGSLLVGIARVAANLMDRSVSTIGLDPFEDFIPTLRRLAGEVVR